MQRMNGSVSLEVIHIITTVRIINQSAMLTMFSIRRSVISTPHKLLHLVIINFSLITDIARSVN